MLHVRFKTKSTLQLSVGELIGQLDDAGHAALEDSKPYKLYCHISSMWYVSSLYFMMDVHEVLAELSKHLQADKLTLNDYLQHTSNAVDKIKEMKFTDRRHTAKFKKNFKRSAATYCGVPIGRMSEELEFEADKLVAIEAFARNLTDRAMFDDTVLQAFAIFDNSHWPSGTETKETRMFGASELSVLYHHYKRFLPDDCELTDVCLSFIKLRKDVAKSAALKQLGHYDLWMQILSLTHRKNYDAGLTILIEISVLFPVDTAFLERVFSIVNRIQSKSRNSLLPEMLNHILVICLLGPPDKLTGLQAMLFSHSAPPLSQCSPSLAVLPLSHGAPPSHSVPPL